MIKVTIATGNPIYGWAFDDTPKSGTKIWCVSCGILAVDPTDTQLFVLSRYTDASTNEYFTVLTLDNAGVSSTD